MSIKQFMILNLCFLYTNRSLHKIYFVPVKERTRTKLRTNYSGVVRKHDAQCRITKWHQGRAKFVKSGNWYWNIDNNLKNHSIKQTLTYFCETLSLWMMNKMVWKVARMKCVSVILNLKNWLNSNQKRSITP